MTGLRYVHKPVVVQAMQVPPVWDGKGAPIALVALANWLGIGGPWSFCGDGNIEVRTDAVVISVAPGDWIIKDQTGAFHYCDDATFAARYEALV